MAQMHHLRETWPRDTKRLKRECFTDSVNEWNANPHLGAVRYTLVGCSPQGETSRTIRQVAEPYQSKTSLWATLIEYL
ncbi:hypothetical protein V1478_012908 [Vespula squamosa]|uniref:Uncharacterized protein n=1 Tax=Vespula squamosa TaxID=30214 RepID=A0ABD2A9A2_VESSQ